MFVVWVASHLTEYRRFTLRRLLVSLANQTVPPDKVFLSVSLTPGLCVDFGKLFCDLPFPVCTLLQPRRLLQGEHWVEMFKKCSGYDPQTWIYFIDDDDELLPETIQAMTEQSRAVAVEVKIEVFHDCFKLKLGDDKHDLPSKCHRWESVQRYFIEKHDLYTEAMKTGDKCWLVDIMMTWFLDSIEPEPVKVLGRGVGVVQHYHHGNITSVRGPGSYESQMVPGTCRCERVLDTFRK